MSTFFTLVFVAVAAVLFGGGAWHAYKTRRAFKQGWAELERELEDRESW